jgi:hypothetical protein
METRALLLQGLGFDDNPYDDPSEGSRSSSRLECSLHGGRYILRQVANVNLFNLFGHNISFFLDGKFFICCCQKSSDNLGRATPENMGVGWEGKSSQTMFVRITKAYLTLRYVRLRAQSAQITRKEFFPRFLLAVRGENLF